MHKEARVVQKGLARAEALLAKKGASNELVAHINTVLPKVPAAYKEQRASLMMSLCRAHIGAHDGKSALQACSALVDSRPDDAEAVFQRAEAHMLLEDYESGASSFHSMTVAHTNLAAIAALRDFNRATEINPGYKEAADGKRRAEVAMTNANKNDYYATLGVPKSASKADIKRAYRKLAQEWHPDKQSPEDRPKAEKRMAQINLAYEVLSDDEKRKQYDMGSDPNDPSGGQQQHHHQQHQHHQNIFNMFGGGQGGRGPFQNFHFNFG